MKRVRENVHRHACQPLQKYSGEDQNKAKLPHSLCRLLLPAVPRRSPAKLGGRCCCAKLALKCLPCSPVSPTTQSNRIRSLYLCLGQVRHRSCVHPRSTFGVEGPPAVNVRPQKNSFTLIFCLSSASADNPAAWLPAAALTGGGKGREVSWGLWGGRQG